MSKLELEPMTSGSSPGKVMHDAFDALHESLLL